MDKRFIGTGVAVITPFKNYKIDFDGLTVVVNHIIDGGVDYLVVLGSTGEAATLSEEECRQVLDHVIKVNAGRKPIVAGQFAGNNTHEVCERIKRFDFTGIDAILSSSPAYVKPSQEGIYQHYMAIADTSPVPIILYNVPGRTRSNMEWSTTVRLARDSSKFIAIKEASGDLIQATKILKNKPDHFLVVSGDDELALALTALGGNGVISVIGNVLPRQFSSMIAAGLRSDMHAANRLNQETYDLHQWLYIEGNPTGVKAAAEVLGLCSREVRLPLVSMTEQAMESLRNALQGIMKQ